MVGSPQIRNPAKPMWHKCMKLSAMVLMILHERIQGEHDISFRFAPFHSPATDVVQTMGAEL